MDMKIVDKIQKLLALSESSNEHEASLAAERAHTLLAKHNLSMAQIEEVGENQKLKEDVGHTSAVSKLGAKWVRSVWQATARLYFCEYLYSSGNHKTYHTVVGTVANATTACHMADFFTQTVVKLSKNHANGISNSSFRTGCALRLVQRLTELRQVAESKPVSVIHKNNLPALYERTKEQLDNYISDTWADVSPGSQRKFSVADRQAYSAGRNAANNIGLNTQTSKTNDREALTNGTN
mgnify:FL=1